MHNKFVPFDKFEYCHSVPAKTLHETMQESCNDHLKPEPETCATPCVPYWVPTGNRNCKNDGVVEIEESNGCGYTRFTRTTETVVWADTENTRCDEPSGKIQKEQVNQCGITRWIYTSADCPEDGEDDG